jgi:hypothetical protein
MDNQHSTYSPDRRPHVTELDRGSLRWRTSSFSSGQGGNCLEVAPVLAGGVAVRHSKNPDGAVLTFSDAEWNAFLDGADEFRFPR